MSQLVECRDAGNGAWWVTLNDPETRNAMSEGMALAFSKVVESLRANSKVRVVVLTGAGNVFSGGGHLDMLAAKMKIAAHENRHLMLQFYHHFLSLRDLEVPVIAAINGHAMGAALGVALACDLRILSENAKVGLNFVKLGLHPGMATTYFLQRLVGPARAAELMYTGRTLTAVEAMEYGLVNRVVKSDEFQKVVENLAQEITEGGPLAISQLKLSLRLNEDQSLEEALKREAECQAISYAGSEFAEGLAAAREKRKPNY